MNRKSCRLILKPATNEIPKYRWLYFVPFEGMKLRILAQMGISWIALN